MALARACLNSKGMELKLLIITHLSGIMLTQK